MRKELHLFPVLRAELEMFCHDTVCILIPDERRRLKLAFPPFGVTEELTFHLWGGWIVEQLGLPLCCKALGCSVSVSLSPSSACLGAERSCCLIIPDVGKGLGADGTQHRKQESYGQNETAVLVLA